uniref:Peroxin-7 n=1 Tax=Alexandrium monilatum TaxID=311494 RepID=A0A7S4V7E8_9DINO|mmetsp:Transcript_5275/g.15607  ORF Transcript_5275/g.15607 Transcript_5275/m.15607 type:complete len:406 (+) Transcript_5275:41-1258(+)
MVGTSWPPKGSWSRPAPRVRRWLLQCAWLLGSSARAVLGACGSASFSAMSTLSPSGAGYFRALAWIPAANNSGTDLLVAGGEDQKLRVWQLSGTSPSVTGSLVNTLGGIHGTIWALEWISSDSMLVSASGDGFIRLWPLSVLNSPQTCHVEANGNANDLCCDGDGLGCEGRYVVSWRDAQMSRAGQVHALEWIETESILASSWSDGVVRLWSYNATETPPLAYRNDLLVKGRSYSLTWLSAPGRLGTTSPDWPLPELWHKDGHANPLRVLTEQLPDGYGYCPTAHCGAVHASAANGGGDTLATGSEDMKVKLWSASTGAMLHTFDGHSAAATALEWLHSESKLASGGADGSIFLWDPTDLSSSSALSSIASAHSDKVSALVWMDSLDTLASVSYDMTVKLWHCSR